MNKYGAVVADPPWNYNQVGISEKLSGYSNHQYNPLSTGDLCALGADIKQITTPDAVLFLWTTWPFIKDALDVIDSWGFTFVTGLPWVKVDSKLERPIYGVGYWFRGCTEPILVAKRGRSYRGKRRGILGFDIADASGTLGFASMPDNHSRKPDALQDIVEADYPGPYLELFGRRRRDGWTVLGNEAPCDGQDIRASLGRLISEGVVQL